MQTKDTHNNDHAKNDLYADLQKVKEKAFETRDALAKTAYDAKDKAQEMFENSYEDAKERFSHVREKTANLQENVISYAQENPVKTIGFTFLAGLLLSSILRK